MPPESALVRKIRGPMAPWGLQELLLRRIEHDLRGLQWQNAGKGQKPKPIELPDEKAKQQTGAPGGSVEQRLRALGLVPAGDDKNPRPAPPSEPTAGEMADQADAVWVERHQRLASD